MPNTTSDIKLFLVTITYSYDDDVPTFPFAELSEAKDALKSLLFEEIGVEKVENGWDPVVAVDENGCHATVFNYFEDDTTVIEYRVLEATIPASALVEVK